MQWIRGFWDILRFGYPTRMPPLVSIVFPNAVCQIITENKEVFLSFDDGPHPEITPWVLDQLDAFDAKAIFFLIGDNVLRYPEVVEEILRRGHQIGNHTMKHLDAWKNRPSVLENDILQSKKYISSTLFRPPYGHFHRTSIRLWARHFDRVILWSILSGDFDTNRTAQCCVDAVCTKIKSGDIIVFHDSEKAWPRLSKALPMILGELKNQGYRFSEIPDT